MARAASSAGWGPTPAWEARAKAQDKQEIAAVESELAMLAAQLAAIRKLRKK